MSAKFTLASRLKSKTFDTSVDSESSLVRPRAADVGEIYNRIGRIVARLADRVAEVENVIVSQSGIVVC